MSKPALESVAGKQVLVTGAASGMGRLFARKAALEGASRVIIWDVNEAGLEEVTAELRLLEVNVDAQVVDLAQLDQIKSAAAEAISSGGVDILINNAGVVTGATFEQHRTEQITTTIQINTLAPMYITHELLSQLTQRGTGRILTMASAAGLVSNPNMSVYCASKSAALAWSDSLRLELESDPEIAVTTVCPTYVSTGMFEGAKSMFLTPILQPEQVVERAWKAMLSGTPLVLLPWTSRLGQFLRGVLPRVAWDYVAENVIGIYRSMDEFKGRERETTDLKNR